MHIRGVVQKFPAHNLKIGSFPDQKALILGTTARSMVVGVTCFSFHENQFLTRQKKHFVFFFLSFF